jgi:integrase/recombinase XerD
MIDLSGSVKKGEPRLSLAVVRDLREARVPAWPDELAAFETDVLAGFALARAAAGLADATIRSDVLHLEQVRARLGRPLWEMEPADAMPTSAACCAMRRKARG